MIEHRAVTTFLFCFLGIGLSGCTSRSIPSESASMVETFGGSTLLSAEEGTCLSSRKELASALIKNRNNTEGFQKAVFDGGDVAMAQQVLDCFGERWSRIVRVGVDNQAGDCAAKVFVRSVQASIDSGVSDLRVADEPAILQGFNECRK